MPACPDCQGQPPSCSACDGVGFYRVEMCPKEYAAEAWDVCRLADLADKGIMPTAGGALDQAEQFLDAYRALKADEDALEADAIRRQSRR